MDSEITSSSVLTFQQRIYASVIARGYSAEAQFFTQQQWLYHQWLKEVEELMELGKTFGGVEPEMYRAIEDMRLAAQAAFRRRMLGKMTANPELLLKELADSVPLFVMAETLGVDLAAVCAEKAEADVARGRSK